MSKYIINTVGTSMLDADKFLFNGSIKFGDKLSYPKGFKDPLHKGTISFDAGENSNWGQMKDAFITNMANVLAMNNICNDKLFQLSAEIAALKLFYNQEYDKDTKGDKVVLLYSDTRDGEFCAQVDAEVIARSILNLTGQNISCTVEDNSLDRLTIQEESGQIRVEARKIKQLRMVNAGKKDKDKDDKEEKDKDDWRHNLLGVLEEYCCDCKENGYDRLYFNITGGYKSIIPLVSDLGIAINASVFYKYEEANDLVYLYPISFTEIMRDRDLKGLIMKLYKTDPATITTEKINEMVDAEKSINSEEKTYYKERLRVMAITDFRRMLDKVLRLINFGGMHQKK